MFHVPELSRDTEHPILGTTSADGNNGAFHVESPEPGWSLALIASDGGGWELDERHLFPCRRSLLNWRRDRLDAPIRMNTHVRIPTPPAIMVGPRAE